jgi:CRISPR-associated protein Cmr2
VSLGLLAYIKSYSDRDGKTWGQDPNWTHIYNDWAQLKTRHAIRLKQKEKDGIFAQEQIALALFDLYFNDAGKTFSQQRLWGDIAGDSNDINRAIVNWINDLIQVGWQLCRNSNI